MNICWRNGKKIRKIWTVFLLNFNSIFVFISFAFTWKLCYPPVFYLFLLVLYFTYFVTDSCSFQNNGFKQQVWTICPIDKINQWVSIIHNNNQHLYHAYHLPGIVLSYCIYWLNSLINPWVKHHHYPFCTAPLKGENWSLEQLNNPCKITHLTRGGTRTCNHELGIQIPGLRPLCDVASPWHTI